jgi:DNA-binding NarL/FixJ family response regulator
MDTIKIYVIDDHKLFVEGIYSLLSDEPGFELMGYSLSAKEFLEIADNVKADVYLVDINMPEITGIELTRMIREMQPDARILALTMYEDFQYVEKMIKSGAHGYILKAANLHELIKAITSVAKGEKFLGQEIQDVVFNKIGSLEALETPDDDVKGLLTPREKEILALIAKEYSNPEIAEKLFISERTVETHRKNIFSKTGAKSVIGLIRYAIQHNIVSFNEEG